MILHRYFARRFLTQFLFVGLVLLSLILLVDLIDQLRRFADTTASFRQVLWLAVMKSLGTLNDVIPLILLLATVFMFTGLARTSELVVTRAAGRSALRALIAPGLVTLLVGGVTVSAFGPIVAVLNNRYDVLSEQYKHNGAAALSVSSDGLWLRQGDGVEQTVIRASRSNATASVLFDVSLFFYEVGQTPHRRIEASEARLDEGDWLLRDAKDWRLGPNENAEATALRHGTLQVRTSMTQDQVREAFGTSKGISVWDMPSFIARLETAGFAAIRHQVWFQSELARPFFLLAMMLTGAAFAMRHTRFGGTGPAVLAAVLMGFGLYFIRSFATILGENGQLAVAFAAWAVPVAANLLALGLLLHAEDG